MLKKFFLNALSSFVGAWIAILIFGIIAVMICIGVIANLGVKTSSGNDVTKGSVLKINLSGMIQERENNGVDYFSLMMGNLSKPQTLSTLVTAIGEAKENKNISAIYLKCGGIAAGPATLSALREALNEFKESGKKIISYGDVYTTGAYFVASVSDSIFLNPSGSVMLQGIGGTSFYFKDLLDKLGVSIQVVKVGTYKSAVEPYILNEMSEPARAQLDTLYGGIWKYIRDEIAGNRKRVTANEIDTLINKDFIFLAPAEKDLDCGLVDKLVFERMMDSKIADIIGKDKDDINYVSPQDLVDQTSWIGNSNGKNQIAVVYACGDIVDGGGEGTINYENLVPEIVKLADDKNVKGMVLRVNSPGGAVFGSKQIADALDYFQSKGKPLAVSMGDYAASGGYWISCHANRIFADPLTITGSIGIFGIFPNIEGLTKKIGMTPQYVYTNPDASISNIFKPFSETQKEALQKDIVRGYDEFIDRVATGRNMDPAKVREIGEGRVWGAEMALEKGLIDELGSLQDAIEWIAENKDLGDDWTLSVYPEVETTVWDFIPELGGMRLADAMKAISGNRHDDIRIMFVRSLLKAKPIQARMPYFRIHIDQQSHVK